MRANQGVLLVSRCVRDNLTQRGVQEIKAGKGPAGRRAFCDPRRMLESRANDAYEFVRIHRVDFRKRVSHALDINFAARRTATLNLTS